MDVIGLVATDAVPGGIPISPRSVTFFAADRRVQAHQGEARHVVIKADFVTPARLNMARTTLRAHGAAVDIVGLVAPGAVLGQLRPADRSGMTGVTIDFRVLAFEFPVRLLLVIVARVLPTLFGMTLLAVIAETSTMAVVSGVAARALVRNFGLGVT